MRKNLSPNPNMQLLIAELKALYRKEKAPLWQRVAEEMSRSTRQRREVNLSTIEESCKPGEIALIPGKVLGIGELKKKVTVAAFNFSESAKSKIKERMSLQELMKSNPKGKNVRILG